MGGKGVVSSQNTILSSMVSIYCKSAVNGAYNFELTMKNVRLIQKDLEGKVLNDDNSVSLQQKFGKYMIFSLTENGKVFDVYTAAGEEKDVLLIKSGIVSKFHFAEETANAEGLYTSAYEVSQNDDSVTLTRSFSEKDFISFYHLNMTANLARVVSSEIKTFQGNLPQSADSASVVSFSAEKNGVALISAQSVSSLTMTFSGKGNAHTFNGKLTKVLYFDPVFYVNRKKEEVIEKPILHDPQPNCPTELDYCQTFKNSSSVESHEVKVSMTVSGIIGINDECPSTTRNFDAKVESVIDISFLGIHLGSSNVLVEYGYIDGVPQKNEILATVFDKTLYQFLIPDVLCNQSSIKSPTYEVASPTWNYTYVIAGIIPVTFELGANVTINVELTWDYCDKNTSAYLQIVPNLNITSYADAEDSIVIAKGGLVLDINGTETSNPSFVIDGDKCVIDVLAYVDSDYNATMDAWIQVNGGDKQDINIFNNTIFNKDLEVLNFEWKFGLP